MRAATVVQQLCKSCRTCFKFYCMFRFTCDRSFSPKELGQERSDVDVFKSVRVENVVKKDLGEHFVGKVLLMRQNLCYEYKNRTVRASAMWGYFFLTSSKTNE